jgi:hypothetical protein
MSVLQKRVYFFLFFWAIWGFLTRMDTNQFASYSSRYDYDHLRIGLFAEYFSWTNCDNFAVISLLFSLTLLIVSYQKSKFRISLLSLDTIWLVLKWLFLRATYRHYGYGGITWDTELIVYDGLQIGLRIYLILWLLRLNLMWRVVALSLFLMFYYFKAHYLEWQLFVCF